MRNCQSFVVLPILGILTVDQSGFFVEFGCELELRGLAFSSYLINLKCLLDSQVIDEDGNLLFPLRVMLLKFVESSEILLKNLGRSVLVALYLLTQLVVLSDKSILVAFILAGVLVNFNRCSFYKNLEFNPMGLRVLQNWLMLVKVRFQVVKDSQLFIKTD